MTPEQFILQEEGRDGYLGNGQYKAVWDALGKCWTIGPGLTQGITSSTRMTQDQVDRAFSAELEPFEQCVDTAVKVPLTQNERTALVSFAYNCGTGAFLASTLLKKLNTSHLSAVPGELMKYVHAKGASGPVPGLVNRRRAEVNLWNTPDTRPSPPSSNPDKTSVPKATSEQETPPMTVTAVATPASAPTSISGLVSFFIGLLNSTQLQSVGRTFAKIGGALLVAKYGVDPSNLASVVGGVMALGGIFSSIKTHANAPASSAAPISDVVGAAVQSAAQAAVTAVLTSLVPATAAPAGSALTAAPAPVPPTQPAAA